MSGIYIPGMEMPKNCWRCEVGNAEQMDNCPCPFYMIDGEEQEKYAESRHPNCPLTPVPEHGDLIDKRGVDVLSWNEKDEGDFEDGVLFVLDKLDELPVIIPADKEGEG